MREARRGLSLLEVTVVVLVLGIIAAFALPKLLDPAGDAREASAQQSLAVIRDAILLFRSANGGQYPGQSGTDTEFKTELKPYLRGPFPKCPVGNKNADVRVLQTGNALSPWGSQGWAYDSVSGEFIINKSPYNAY